MSESTKTDQIMNRKCLDCAAPIAGRADKKFCSDGCRNNFNNRMNSDANGLVRNINNILRKNRRILEDISPGAKTRVHQEKLAVRGFNFDYYTSVHTNKKGGTCYFCYEYGYMKVDEEFLALIRNEMIG